MKIHLDTGHIVEITTDGFEPTARVLPTSRETTTQAPKQSTTEEVEVAREIVLLCRQALEGHAAKEVVNARLERLAATSEFAREHLVNNLFNSVWARHEQLQELEQDLSALREAAGAHPQETLPELVRRLTRTHKLIRTLGHVRGSTLQDDVQALQVAVLGEVPVPEDKAPVWPGLRVSETLAGGWSIDNVRDGEDDPEHIASVRRRAITEPEPEPWRCSVATGVMAYGQTPQEAVDKARELLVAQFSRKFMVTVSWRTT